MKKLFLLSLTVALALFVTPLNAQVHIQIGPKVGINIANVGGDDAILFWVKFRFKVWFWWRYFRYVPIWQYICCSTRNILFNEGSDIYGNGCGHYIGT